MSSFVTLAGSEQYAPAHVLYAVGHRSLHEASSSPLAAATGDSSPQAPSQLSPAAGSPHWFAHSPSPPSPSRLTSASGELSPAHASALQQQFQQFSMASVRCVLLVPCVGLAAVGTGLVHFQAGCCKTQLSLALVFHLLPLPRRMCFRNCLSVCLLAALCKNFQTHLHEIFREGWQLASK